MAGEPGEIDKNVPHMARVYDYMLGGTNNFAVDRELAVHATEAIGGIDVVRGHVRANRRFLVDAVRWLAIDGGIRQFLDIGTGIPNADNVHGVAQDAAPDSRVVYVDYDPVVLAHAHKLLKSTPQGATDFVYGDLREPDNVLAQAAGTLDFDRPVALMLVGIFHYVLDREDPYAIMRRLAAAVAPGSYVVVSHLASDIEPEQAAEMVRRHNERSPGEPTEFRSCEGVERFYEGLELLPPGVVSLDRWHVPGGAPPPPAERQVPIYGALGRKPEKP
jgi:SAM-dependent methyltransferase